VPTGIFGRKKKEQVAEAQTSEELTDLDKICSSDKEVCEALKHIMFYDPRKIQTTAAEAAKKAAEFEKKGAGVHAKKWYHIAGGLALWKGDVAKVKQYFSKCAKLSSEVGYEKITEDPEWAISKAGEFYKKFLS
jgi:hypothetical protein